MTNILTRGLAALALTAAVTAPAPAQVIETDNTAYGTTAAEFLLLGAGARGTALGGAFSALTSDVTALYYNPGGVALMPRPQLMVSTYSYVADTRYSWLGIAFPMAGGQRAIGFSAGTFGFSDQPVTTIENPDGDGRTYSVAQTFLQGTYAQNFSDRFSAGISLKFINDELGETAAQGFAVDFGTNFHATVGERPIRASFVIQNLGTTLTHRGAALDVTVLREPPLGVVDIPQEPAEARLKTKDFGLPVMFRVGVALDVVTQGYTRVTVLSEFTQPNNTRPGAGAGLELGLTNVGNSGFSFAARGSYTLQPDNDLDPGNGAGFVTQESLGSFTSDGLALGGGIEYARGTFRVGFDYAWKNLGPLGGTNFLSFSLGW
ncbi:MAG TPA: PorV/PorQ family protein [Gemmatimonadales bacterium]|nr:PorV/PorQ family protein [Gemmatimonadales bacterium]